MIAQQVAVPTGSSHNGPRRQRATTFLYKLGLSILIRHLLIQFNFYI